MAQAKNVYNRVYTAEKWERVNKFNKDLLNDYMMQIKSERKSEGSQKQYFNDARIIMIYILEELENKPLYKLNRKSFRNMILWMQENGMSPARINRLLSTSRNLLNFGMSDDEYEDEFDGCKANPTRIRGLVKEEVREIVFLSDSEVLKIYNVLVEQERYCEALLCSLMYDSACRRNEAFQVLREDISLDGNVTKREVIGKRGKKFKLMYHDLTKKAYELLEKSRTDENKELWVSKNGQPISYETLYAWCISWRNILDCEKEFNNHSFRHSALTNYEDGTHYVAQKLNKRFNIQELKLLAHHDSIDTTNSYLQCREEEILMEAFGI